MNLFRKITIILASVTSVLNIVAFIFLRRRAPIKPFDILLMNIVLLNVIYSLNELSTCLVHIFGPPGILFRNLKFFAWFTIKSSILILTLSSFIVIIGVQRVIVTALPLKAKLYVRKKSTWRLCLIIYAFALTVFAILTILIWTDTINFKLTMVVMMCMLDAGSIFILFCYTLITFLLKKSSRNNMLQASNIKRSRRYRKTIIVAFIVSISFCVSYDPVATLLIMGDSGLTYAFQVALYLVWIDSTINPIMIILDSYFMNKKRHQVRPKKQVGSSNTTEIQTLSVKMTGSSKNVEKCKETNNELLFRKPVMLAILKPMIEIKK